MIYAAAISHRRELVYYLILFAVVMLLGTAARKSEQKFVKMTKKCLVKTLDNEQIFWYNINIKTNIDSYGGDYK